ncbi:MAG: hypothetical protein V4527_14570 [Pseudomonadota bacterium]
MSGAIGSRLKGLYYKLRYFYRLRDCKLYCEGTLRLGKGSLVSGGVVVIGPGAVLDIGDQVYIGHFCNIRVQERVTIGDGCKIAQFVSIVDHDYDFRSSDWAHQFRVNEVVVGTQTMIGTGAILLRGVTIAPNSIVPANLVLRRNDRDGGHQVISRRKYSLGKL